jgi:predicted dehydrogenase
MGMESKVNRRSFIKRSALAAGAMPFLTFPNIGSAAGKSSAKLNCVQVGCGGRAMTHLDQVIDRYGQNLAAIVDPDEKSHSRVASHLKSKGIDTSHVQHFSDYRVMFDKMGKQIDAVFVTTPNHHHANVALMAMQRGINVYCEKPLCHDIAEARQLREAARQYKNVATQMGNQGHCEEGYRRLCEYIWAGAIGKVTETHSWTDRANGGVGPRPPSLPVPAGLNWDSWIGPAPYRDFHSDLHPHEWHGWYDFGNGSIGNMACHVLDGVFWSLKIGHPDSIEVEMLRGGSDERYPIGSRIRWDVPARAEMPPLKVYWYEGLNEKADANAIGRNDGVQGKARNLPPLLLELQKQYPDDELGSVDSGTLYVGDKGIIYTETYGRRMHVVPMEKMDDLPKLPILLPRPKNVFGDFLDACLAGKSQTAAPFEYGAQLTEFAILGNLAQHAGTGHKVEWDGPNMKVTNIPELNRWIKREKRNGWTV